ncbi:type II toxin-antitoxin system YafQ family toxin [Deefgea sp. CFH1-16]|uniref:type II toxin-antitoxin system YafQ family toxin n=1 Tax=Deefgea sp. CFH1-16 TaxID=2675457 RepID=UPI0027DBA930|nr:type II toxin-antitoxin system YafQ family toxin [Deefgea sp. CFH1-16]
MTSHYLPHPSTTHSKWIGRAIENVILHIGGDFLLIYQTLDSSVYFVRTGTHSELFK